jgi:uncharacterized membrane protein YfcA
LIDNWLLISLVVFLAVFTQSLTGFGSALVAMAMLPALMGIKTATPLVALLGLTIEIALLLRYHAAFHLQSVWRLAVASVAGIPVGLLVLSRLEESLVLAILGAVLVGYSLYALLGLRLPRLQGPAWAYGTGFLAGMLGGAYNTSGPPVVIYGDAQRWPPPEFKSNLQGFFFVTSLVVIAGHTLSGNLAHSVWLSYLLVLPAVILGILLGTRLDGRIDPVLFRKLVLVLLIVMGMRMILFS